MKPTLRGWFLVLLSSWIKGGRDPANLGECHSLMDAKEGVAQTKRASLVPGLRPDQSAEKGGEKR